MKDKNNDVVVVGGDHYNTLWVVRSLGIMGFKPTVVVVNPLKKCSFVTKSKYASTAYVVSNEVEMLELLKKLSFLERVVVFSSSDRVSDVIDQNYGELKKKYILPNCGEQQGMLSYWMDKRVMTELAVKSGFNIPYSVEINLSNGQFSLPNDIPYPCVLKPLKSSAGQKTDFRICVSRDELEKALISLRIHCASVLLQEYIKPDFEISILGMRSRTIEQNLVPGLLYKMGTCQSVRNMGMPTYAYVEESVEPYVDRTVVDNFLNSIDYDGLYSIEFFVSGGKAYFLEINLRVDGDLFVYTIGGVNMPYLWACLSVGILSDASMMKLKKNRTYGMTEISYIKYLQWKKTLKVIEEWWKADCYSIFSWKDPLPFFYKFIFSI